MVIKPFDSHILIIPPTYCCIYGLMLIENNQFFVICQIISFILNIHVISECNNPKYIQIIYFDYFFTQGMIFFSYINFSFDIKQNMAFSFYYSCINIVSTERSFINCVVMIVSFINSVHILL